MPNVLFSTNTYEKDFKYLSTGGFEYKALLNDYPFAAKWIITGDGVDPIVGEEAFEGIADIVFTRDLAANNALSIYGFGRDIFVDKSTGVDGYKYSIDSLIEIAHAKGFDYICHFCGDVEIYKKADWITEGIRKIEQEGYFGARPRLPRYEMQVPGEQEMTETDIFSDHVYLVPVKFLDENLQDIFDLTEPSCADIHVPYGGESFERKMTRFMKVTGAKMAIIQNAEEMPSEL